MEKTVFLFKGDRQDLIYYFYRFFIPQSEYEISFKK